VVLRRLGQGVAGLSVTIGLAGPPAPTDPAGTAVMEVLDDPQPPTTLPPTTLPPTTRSATVPPVAPAPAAPDEEVVVAPGDSFWSLAVDAVTEHPRPVAVDEYWRRLIARNRARLVDPANPDLLYPGQVLTLPPIEG
jgi:nucleoid-associated protein YgaU